MYVNIFQLGPLETNCYLVYNDAKEAVVIDPGGDPAEVLAVLRSQGLTLTHILNTHLHFDHIGGNAALSDATGAEILAGEADRPLLSSELGSGGFMGFPKTPSFSFTPLTPGTHTFVGETCHVLATPGHSPGSLSLYFPVLGAVFCGDLIFYRSVGRTDFPGGDEKVLKESACSQILVLPEETIIYPGHGPQTDVRDARENNPFFTDFHML
ncbi:MBL fold metallo-hydrolase [Desulfoplanes formicivorans]|uniref:MBL fold metallo-hydrolase n=1 Tax=Desulfoplanes formicivorans TaxID=1592317 RepID=UPI000852FF85|nr:MBL fold metallo-hydrolase [Desulfoplanes formicivorans]